ncbi:MAG: hypothetical protein ACRD0D_00495 [Acidimicrobiales bacterium]
MVFTGQYVGFAIGAVVIAIVVVLASIILGLARRIGVQALAVTAALDESRLNTIPLWEVDKLARAIRGVTQKCAEARAVLEGADQ